jgi:hypothetical protein
LANNQAPAGGGIFGAAVLNNTIVANNTPHNCSTPAAALEHSLDGDGTCGGSPVDPLLGPLQDNGGDTLTHALLRGSPAIDAGDNAFCTLPTDQRGEPFARKVDGDANGSVICDIGAFELQTPYPPACDSRFATIRMSVDALPDSPRNFRFFGAFGNFLLDDPGDDDRDQVGRTVTFSQAGAGTHNFSDALPFRWSLGGVVCLPAANCAIDLVNRTVAVTVKPCDVVDVAFTHLQKGSLYIHSYWDKNADGGRQFKEPMMKDWWTEVYDVTAAKGVAANFTNGNGKFNVMDIVSNHQYRVCQKPRQDNTGNWWVNTQPGPTSLDARGWPCYTFTLQPAQAADLWFGYALPGTRTSIAGDPAASGMRILDNVLDAQQNAMYTQEEFVDIDAQTPEPYESEDTTHLYLPEVAGQ